MLVAAHLVERLGWTSADLRSLERCANDFHPGLVLDLAQINLVSNEDSGRAVSASGDIPRWKTPLGEC